MATVSPQPKTRQRALLKAWGFDESIVLADGIDERGIMVLGYFPERGTSYMASDELAKTCISYQSEQQRDEMMKAREDDWDEYVSARIPQ